MKMTTHANIRQQQRGIPPMIIDLLRDYGACESAGNGTTKYYFDKGSRRKLKTYAGQLASLLEEHLNCYLIVCPKGNVITVAPRIKRIKH